MDLKKWLPTGKITAVMFGGAIAIIIILILQPEWDDIWVGAFVFAVAVIFGYLMPETMPWNKSDES